MWLRTRYNVDGRELPFASVVPAGTGRYRRGDDRAVRPGRRRCAAAARRSLKGQALEYRATDRVVLAGQADLRRIDAWRTRRLEFGDAPLAEAVDEFNRYSRMKVVIETPGWGEVHVSGVFRIGDTEGFLFSLREALGVEARHSGDEALRVRSGY